ncbi:plipastatin synthase subunit B-like [Folsomia candida]|uniref:plipastatin synthase subunit B-like n=1 Tax=Folsomia candida TaxID=158441 RepID=UPI001605338D|nr:plipastatin synthase subunit B-like [Folsomia candida]
MACEDFGCVPCFCEGHDDGVLRGKTRKIEDKFKKPISIVFQNLLKSGKINGKKNALQFCDNYLTFDQLEDFSTSLALDIRDRIGMDVQIRNPDGDPVIAIIIPNSEKAIVIMMAVLKTGAAYLPLDEEYPEHLFLRIIEKFRPVLIIADDNGPIFNKYDANKFSEYCSMVSLEELWVRMEIPTGHVPRKTSIKREILSVFNESSESQKSIRPAGVFHTRGFHSNPYGVRIGHAAILNRCIFEWKQLDIHEHQSCSLTTPVSQVDSVSQIFSALLKGCTLVIFTRADMKDVTQFLKDVASKMINRLVIPHYMFYEVLRQLKVLDPDDRVELMKSLLCVKYVVCRGGYIRHVDVAHYFQVFPNVPLGNCTGSAETSGDMIYDVFRSVKDFVKKRVLGRVTLELAIISDGHQGELCISGACLAMDYVDPGSIEDNKHNFAPNPHEDSAGYEMIYRSGEYGRIIKCTDVFTRLDLLIKFGIVEGRDDKVIRQKGHEFHLDDVKPFLEELEYAADAFLYVLNKGKPTQEMVGFILIKPGISPHSVPHPLEIERQLRNKLPEWAIPDDIMLIQAVPKHYYNDNCPFCLIREFREQREPRSNAWETQLVVPGDRMEAAVTLVKAMFRMAYIPVETTVANLKASFFDIGGTSLSTIPLLVYLNKRGYPITLRDFYTTSNLMEIISLMTLKKPMNEEPGKMDDKSEADTSIIDDCVMGQWVKPNFHIMLDLKETYNIELIRKRHKTAVINIIAYGYCEKGALSQYNMISYQELNSFLSEAWSSYVEEKLSIVVIEKSTNKIVAVAICQDFFKLVDTTKATGTLYNIMEFYQEVKGNILLFLPHRIDETLEICWMATHTSLSAQENVKIITMLHTEIIKLARQKYSGIFHSTANLLSRTLCTEVFGYEVFEDFQINKYRELDGSQPFHLAGDNAACAALYLKLRDPNPPSEATSMTVVDPVQYFNQVNRKRISGIKYYHNTKSISDVA